MPATTGQRKGEALDACEHAALVQVLRKLGALDRLDEVARDFALRGVHALQALSPEAEELFDDAYWCVDPGSGSHRR